MMWGMRPSPGFGGRELDDADKEKLGLSGKFAFRVNYYDGDHARNAGIKKGDVVLSAGGKSDFQSHRHFHAWFRLTQKPGADCEIVLLRDGVRETVKLPVLP